MCYYNSRRLCPLMRPLLRYPNGEEELSMNLGSVIIVVKRGMWAPSRRSHSVRPAPGENLIFGIGRWRLSVVVPFWEAPFWSPSLVVVHLTSPLWLLMVEVPVGTKLSSSHICSLLGCRWGGASVPGTFVSCLGCVCRVRCWRVAVSVSQLVCGDGCFII